MGATRRLLAAAAVLLIGCAARTTPEVIQTFHSRALGRTMAYQVFLPARTGRVPVVYLLHGHGGNVGNWFSATSVAGVAERLGLAVVTPEGGDSWYVNGPGGRWMDYVVDDLVAEVEGRWPVARDRTGRAIAGLSMGGYGALNIALQRPERFALAASMSGALDTPRDISVFDPTGARPDIPPVFGPAGSATRRDNDIYARVRHAMPAALPFVYLDCGLEDPWVAVNREFASRLDTLGIAHAFHTPSGGHDWTYWNRQIAEVLALAARRLR